VLGAVLLAGVVFTTLVGILLTVLAGRVTWLTAVTAGSDIALMSAWFVRERSMRAASGLAIGAVAIAVALTMMQSGGLRAPVLILMPLLPVLVASFAGTRGAWWMGSLLVLDTVLIGCATRLDLLPPSPLSEAARDSMGVAYVLASIGLAVYASRATELERKSLERALDVQARALYETSVHDPLTHLYNRRYLAHRLDEELAFATRHGTGLGVVILDVDHFKKINDEHGHGGGDEVLTALGAILHDAVRREDVVARYGGEEFVILLRGLDLASAAIAAERVRSAVEAHTFSVGGHRVPVTVSSGCASLACCAQNKTVGHLIAVADARLYRAKRGGRNRVASTD
jgi:diguanylate cyclase (GGDEF)-like protein